MKIKFLIGLMFALVLVSSVVFADGHMEAKGGPEDIPKEPKMAKGDNAPDVEAVTVKAEMKKPEIEEKPELYKGATDTPKGLELALTKVKNENASMRLQQNLERFQEKYQERLDRMEDLEVEEVDEDTGAVKLKAKEDVKYLGFIKGKATKRFNVNAEGVISEKAPWYRFLYAEEN